MSSTRYLCITLWAAAILPIMAETAGNVVTNAFMGPPKIFRLFNRNSSLFFASAQLSAQEMTAVPQGIHEQTIQAAQTTAPMVTQPLIAKWIGFGQIPVFPDGSADTVDTDDIGGVASDLIIKPFDRLRDGEDQQAREAFAHLSESDQQAAVESLTTLIACGFFQPWHRPWPR
jgi:hypothetical protein